jgi:hypothetical protein
MKIISVRKSSATKFFLICSLTIQSPGVAYATIPTASIRYTSYQIDGHSFEQRVDVQKGKRIEKFSIDGKSVEEALYQIQFSQADENERKREREQVETYLREQELEVARQQQFKVTARISYEKKRMIALVQHIESLYAKLNSDKLRPFYFFSTATIANQETLAAIMAQELPEAKKLVALEDVTAQLLQEMSNRLEKTVRALQTFSRDSVNNALARSDDSCLLRELVQEMTS